MSESINDKSEASLSTSSQEASLEHVEEAMKRLRIHPVSGFRYKPLLGAWKANLVSFF